MRTLSIITLCFIIAASAYAGERRDRGRDDANDHKPAAAQSSPPPAASAPAPTVTITPSAPPPAAPAPTVQPPAASFQPSPTPAPSVSYSPAPAAPARPAIEPVSSGGSIYRGENRRAQNNEPDRTYAPAAPAPAPAAPATSYQPGHRDPAPANPSSAPRGGSVYTGEDRRSQSNEPDRRPVSVNAPPSSSDTSYRPGKPETPGSPGQRRGGSVYIGEDRRAQSNEPDHRSASVGVPSTSSGTSYRPAKPEIPGSVDQRRGGGSIYIGENRRPQVVDKKPAIVPGSRPDTRSGSNGYTPDRRGQNGSDDKYGHRPSDGHNRPDTKRVYSTGYSPNRTTYTVGYHRPSRFYVPKTYVPPVYRQGYYHYPAAYHHRPCIYPYWAFDYTPGFSYRSVYYNFSLFPYVQITRITEVNYTTVNYSSEPIYVSGGSYYETPRYNGLDQALADIRSAWISGRFDLIQKHVRLKSQIAVLLDGQYDYAISSEDYLYMTRDAITELDTASFIWDTVRERHDGSVTAFGEQSYSTSGKIHDVFVSYTLQKIGREFYITEVGSSLDPLDQ